MLKTLQPYMNRELPEMGWRMGENQGKEEGKSATTGHRKILSVAIN